MESNIEILKDYLASQLSTTENGKRKSVPVELAYNDQMGRHLIASEDIQQGQIIFWETPLVLAPKQGSGPNCLDCFLSFADNDWPHCRDCGMPRCFPVCQGREHSKEECDIIKKWGYVSRDDIPLVKQLNVILTVLRTYLACKNEPGSTEIFESLQSNKEKRKNMSIGKFVEQYIVKFFQESSFNDISRNFIEQVTGVFDTNAFEVSWKNNIKARALLPAGALMNHECIPNTQHWFYNGQCVFRATVAISKGTPVTNSYTKTLWGTKSRQEHLRMTKLFECSCKRCLDTSELGTHISSIKCGQCEEGFLTLMGTWKCSSCSVEVPENQINARLHVASSVAASARTLDVFSLFKSIKRLSTFLGFQYYVLVELQFTYIQLIATNCSSETAGHLQEVYEMATKLLEIINKLEPGFTKLRGLLLHCRCNIFLEIYSQNNKKSSQEKEIGSEMVQLLDESLKDAEMSREILLYDFDLPAISTTHKQLKLLKENFIIKQMCESGST